MEIRLPNNWRPRPYQAKAWNALSAGIRRAAIVAHRRWGKDDIALHHTACCAMERPGNYWHCLPEYSQGRKAIWTAVNPHTGKKRIDEAFPVALRKRTIEQEMAIEFLNGATWQVIGSDTYDRLVGAPPIGIVFSEYALADPAAWDYFRPILAENGGWAVFISTVRGRNHFWKLAEMAKRDPGWFYLNQTARETNVFTPEQLEQERKELRIAHGDDEGDARFAQEYMNDPTAALPGAYYGRQITRIEQEGRIRIVPWDSRFPVTTAWDLGIGDSTAIWFAQEVDGLVRIIDYYEASGAGLDHYAKVLREKPYTYEELIWPHDGDNSELGTGRTRADVMREFGFRVRILPRVSIDDGIQAARTLLDRSVFDEIRTEKGVNALRQYQREWDDKLHDFKSRPKHDWTSHGSDGFRYLALGIKPAGEKAKRRARFAEAPTAVSDYAMFG